MNSYKYQLEKGSKKTICPSCGKKSFVRYIDTKNNNYLPKEFGRCDRESKCNYHLNPYQSGYAKEIWLKENKGTNPGTFKNKYVYKNPTPQPEQTPIFFDFNTFKQTLQPERYEKNTFIQNLLFNVKYQFDIKDITKVIELYRLGTISKGYRTGALTLPFIDISNNIRAIQVKQFNKQNHTTATDWLHSIITKYYTKKNKPLPGWLKSYLEQEKKVSCLFGEHLLNKYPNNPVALVEAPKTAIYGNLYFGLPKNNNDFIWLAVFNKSSLSFDKIKVLKNRLVYVFPDLSKGGSTFKEWKEKTKQHEKFLPGTKFIFSDLLERFAPEQDKLNGYDIADYLIKLDWKLFRTKEIQDRTATPPTTVLENKEIPIFKKKETPTKKLQDWSNELKELENYFSKIKLPSESIKLNEFTKVDNCKLFIDNQIITLKKNNGKKAFIVYLKQLRQLKSLFINELKLKEHD